MCGISGIFGRSWSENDLAAMVQSQRHRGPDGEGMYIDPARIAGLGQNRLAIIDLTDAASQPMFSSSGDIVIVLNGEIYNYLELKRELESEFSFRTRSDTEVLLAAYQKWGRDCLHKLIGMFAFIIWDVKGKRAFAARDRFGVKPLNFHQKSDGTLLIASEIKSLQAAGVSLVPDERTWATYLATGQYDHSNQTFWKGVEALPPGHFIEWKDHQIKVTRWYDIGERVGDEVDTRNENEVAEEYLGLMKESVNFRFRSDVPVGINLSGGLDSSTLLGLVHAVQGEDSAVKVFTFATGDENYDELPWVEQMVAKTKHDLVICKLRPDDVPVLANEVQASQDEPFGGLPTIAYSNIFKQAKENGVTVLLDGNGMDEQWAGYDYYLPTTNGDKPGLIQGTNESPVKPDCLMSEFRSLAEVTDFPLVFSDRIRNLQYRDTRYTKIPKVLRFNDRISMKYSTELREPFLDHRLFELAFRQPNDRKIKNGTRKVMLRKIAGRLVPDSLTEAPKRPLQTPQREWLRNELKDWADQTIDHALDSCAGNWLNHTAVKTAWSDFCSGKGDNSFYIWQWISIGLMTATHRMMPRAAERAA